MHEDMCKARPQLQEYPNVGEEQLNKRDRTERDQQKKMN